MSSNIYKDASFFKLMSNLSSKLQIPTEFVKKYGEIIPEKALLIINDDSVRCWKVKIKAKDDRLYFTNGWLEFAKDNGLSESDFVTFALENGSTVRVTIYGNNGVKKPASSLPRRQGDLFISDREFIPDSDDGESDDDDVVEIKSFTKVVDKIHFKYCLNIPMKFAKQTGIIALRSINLRNERGKEWWVKVSTRENDGRVGFMTEDWREFWEDNKLSMGSKLTFTFDPRDRGTLLVDIKRT
ncbi:hypothetical protein CASFOL_005798 [Castilleja foliolosa]|uniref:TF-B3 domain-containing protein n=1 Tax=Castilleja foliolosa TaxID=1961234 RepID=A0ABD3E4H7_9LAMI